MTNCISIGGESLTLERLLEMEAQDAPLKLDAGARSRMQQSAACLARAIAGGQLVYGVNTGSGPLAGHCIEPDQVSELQRRILVSNAAGTGSPLPSRIVRRAMLLKVMTLARGASGVRPELAEALLALLNAGVHPMVPAKGSCGASGDLAPLAHIGVALLGLGDVMHQGQRVRAAVALEAIGMAPLVPAAKEGLSLVNGTQVSTALAIEGLFRTRQCLSAALCAAALSVEAGSGNAAAFDERIHAWRNQPGQQDVATTLRGLLDGSDLQDPTAPSRVQDPYCLRCLPQVLGAALDQIRHSTGILEQEINAITDNPLIDLDREQILYGGNFHAQPIGLAADGLALAIAEIGSMAERRIAFLVDGAMSGLPDFLAGPGGLNSGFMVAQVTAASLASENKHLAAPASTDSIPTAANQEDYVSMATYAARRLDDMTANLRDILAIEMLVACQGLDYRRPGRSSGTVEGIAATLRAEVPALDADRFMAPDMAAAAGLIARDAFHAFAPSASLLADPA